MSISPSIQTQAIDITHWGRDTEFAVFPEGARDKAAVIAPQHGLPPYLLPGRRYLFKLSKQSYPEQLWAEVVAYRIGCLLGVQVPPAFAAFDKNTGECGALIEWFYIEGTELFTHAGNFLQWANPGFDRKLGTDHNLADNSVLLRRFAMSSLFEPQEDWRQWWMNALVFDALIGNTDRHQDNWGLIFRAGADSRESVRLAPLFDNGTSLGHERFVDRVQQWSEADLNRYIDKGMHHVRWAKGEKRSAHMALVSKALFIWPRTRDAIANAVFAVSDNAMADALADLPQLELPVPLSTGRLEFMLRLLRRRLALLKALF